MASKITANAVPRKQMPTRHGKGKTPPSLSWSAISDVEYEQNGSRFIKPEHEDAYRVTHVPSFANYPSKLCMYTVLEILPVAAMGKKYSTRFLGKMTFFTDTTGSNITSGAVQRTLGVSQPVGYFSEESTAQHVLDYLMSKLTQMMRIYHRQNNPTRFSEENYKGSEFDATEINDPYDSLGVDVDEEEIVSMSHLTKLVSYMHNMIVQYEHANVRARKRPAASETETANDEIKKSRVGTISGPSTPTSMPQLHGDGSITYLSRLPCADINQWTHEGVYPSPYTTGAFVIVMPSSIVPPHGNSKETSFVPIFECVDERRAQLMYDGLLSMCARDLPHGIKYYPKNASDSPPKDMCYSCGFGDSSHACSCGANFHEACVPRRYNHVIATASISTWTCPNCRLIDAFHATEWPQSTKDISAELSTVQLLKFIKTESTLSAFASATMLVKVGDVVGYHDPHTGGMEKTKVVSVDIGSTPPFVFENGSHGIVTTAGKWDSELKRFKYTIGFGVERGEGKMLLVPISRVVFSTTK